MIGIKRRDAQILFIVDLLINIFLRMKGQGKLLNSKNKCRYTKGISKTGI